MSTEVSGVIKDAVEKYRTAVKEGSEDGEAVLEVYDFIRKLERTTRKDGIFALEEAFAGYLQEKAKVETWACDENVQRKLTGTERFFSAAIRMLLNGYEPEQLREVAVARYHAAGFEGIDALCACMIMVGVLSIQSGEHPMVLRDRLLAVLPEETENRILEKEAAEREREREEAEKIPETFWEEKETPQSPVMDRLNTAISEMEDWCIQRMVQEADDSTLTICLKGMKGAVRKRIFDSFSEPFRAKVYGDMKYMGPVRWRDVEEAALDILKVTEQLKENARSEKEGRNGIGAEKGAGEDRKNPDFEGAGNE